MKTTILTGLLVLGVAATAFADRGERYERNSGRDSQRGDSRGGDRHDDSRRGDHRDGGLPVPPGFPAALVPGNRHSFLPAPPLPSISIHGGYGYREEREHFYGRGYGYREENEHYYGHAVYVPAPYIYAPAYYAPRPVVIVAAPVYYPPVYVAPPVVYVNPYPVVVLPPVVVWSPPVCQPMYYRPGLSVNFSYYR